MLTETLWNDLMWGNRPSRQSRSFRVYWGMHWNGSTMLTSMNNCPFVKPTDPAACNSPRLQWLQEEIWSDVTTSGSCSAWMESFSVCFFLSSIDLYWMLIHCNHENEESHFLPCFKLKVTFSFNHDCSVASLFLLPWQRESPAFFFLTQTSEIDFLKHQPWFLICIVAKLQVEIFVALFSHKFPFCLTTLTKSELLTHVQQVVGHIKEVRWDMCS